MVSVVLKCLCDEGFICKTGNGRNAAYVRIECRRKRFRPLPFCLKKYTLFPSCKRRTILRN